MIAFFLAATLGGLSVLHFYWLAGGARGLSAAIPTVHGQPAFRPSRFATAFVAVALAFSAVVPVLVAYVGPRGGFGALLHWASLALAVVFGLRFVGDFRLCGLFKRVRGTTFSSRDTWVYSPLSLLLGLGFFLVWRQ